MSLIQQFQLAKGPVCVSVFQAEDDGNILLSMHKGFPTQKVGNSLFTESEVADLAGLLRDYLEWDSQLLHTETKTPKVSPKSGIHPEARHEIEEAIKMAASTPATSAKAEAPRKPTARITVLPCLPKYNNVYTCPKCSCHVASNLRIGPTSNLKLCSNCSHVLTATL